MTAPDSAANAVAPVPDSQWGFPARKSWMARETKIGLAVILILVGAFGFVVFQNLHRGQTTDAAVEADPGDAEGIEAVPLPEAVALGPAAQLPEESAPAADPFTADRRLPAAREKKQRALAARADRASQTPLEPVAKADEEFEDSFAGRSESAVASDERPQFSRQTPQFQRSVTPDDGEPFAAGGEESRLESSSARRSPEPSPRAQEAFDPFGELEDEPPSQATAMPADAQDPFVQPRVMPDRLAQETAPVSDEPADPFATLPTGDQSLTPPESTQPIGVTAPAGPRAFEQDVEYFDEFPEQQPAMAEVELQHEEETDDGADGSAAELEFSEIEESSPSEMVSDDSDDLPIGPSATFVEQERAGSTTVVERPVTLQAPLTIADDEPVEQSDPFDQPQPSIIAGRDSLPVNSAPHDLGGFETVGEDRGVTPTPMPSPIPGPAPTHAIRRPSPEFSMPAAAGDSYEVQPSDNFWNISRRLYGSGRFHMALAKHNEQRVPDPQKMRPGVQIEALAADLLEQLYPELIAGGTVASGSAPALQPLATPPALLAPSGFFVADDGSPRYRVGPEDTLTGIAQRHLGRSSRWIQLYEMNRREIEDPKALTIGTVLKLPADASQVQLVGSPRDSR